MFFLFFFFFLKEASCEGLGTGGTVAVVIFLVVFVTGFTCCLICVCGPRCCYTCCPCYTRLICFSHTNDPARDKPVERNEKGAELPTTTGKLYGQVRPLENQKLETRPITGPKAVYPAPGYPIQIAQQQSGQVQDPQYQQQAGFNPPPNPPPSNQAIYPPQANEPMAPSYPYPDQNNQYPGNDNDNDNPYNQI